MACNLLLQISVKHMMSSALDALDKLKETKQIVSNILDGRSNIADRITIVFWKAADFILLFDKFSI